MQNDIRFLKKICIVNLEGKRHILVLFNFGNLTYFDDPIFKSCLGMSQRMVVRSTVIGRTVKSPKLPGTKLTIWHCVSRSSL